MTNARFLSVGQPISSGTHGNTVEYNCIDQALTGKCIKYHNDQWYTFTSGEHTNLYVNISNQNCRDLMGVQLVVFTGEMCQPDTYKLLDCISLATQDDIYVELTGLSADQTYWLNIDGYLHDFCTYDLEINDKPRGMSVNENPLVKELDYLPVKNKFTIQWTLPDSLAHLASQTRIFRRSNREFRSQPLADVPFEINAFGTMQTDYVYTDTVYHPGQYHYRLTLPLSDGRILFLEEFSWVLRPSQLAVVRLDLDYEQNDSIEIRVSNEKVSGELDKIEFNYDVRKHASYPVYVSQYLDRFETLNVQVFNRDSGHQMEFYIALDKLRAIRVR